MRSQTEFGNEGVFPWLAVLADPIGPRSQTLFGNVPVPETLFLFRRKAPKKFRDPASSYGIFFVLSDEPKHWNYNEGLPMAARYQAQILAQIRDGKRAWSYAEIGNDFDAFRSAVVEPPV